jgi:L-threonylcarbamoyladenylate synthase
VTEVCKTERLSANTILEGELNFSQESIGTARAAAILRTGGTVAFPTETVYGLGANALDAAAVNKIFIAKDRPGWDPLIVHIPDTAMLSLVAVIPVDLQSRVDLLAAAFWPGPLTLLLPRTSVVPDAVTAGRALVGVRIPAHPVAQKLIRLAGLPVAAPSANRFGRVSPTTAAHVLEDLDGRIDAVLDGGPTMVGVESTVLDPAAMIVYRTGAITALMIAQCMGLAVNIFQPGAIPLAAPESLPSPGVGLRHYAPRARLELVPETSSGTIEDAFRQTVDRCKAVGGKVGVLLPDGWESPAADAAFPWGAWKDHEGLARRLFAGLRALDNRGVAVIVCPVPFGEGIAAAMRDRLEKGARAK